MLNLEKISGLTPDEIIVALALKDLAEEAIEMAKLIQETYHCFGISEEVIEIWRDRDGYNHEYLTYTGIWQARYLNQKYDVPCNSDSIFEYFKAEYLVNNGYASGYNGINFTDIGIKKRICEYLRNFLNRTKKINSEGDPWPKLPIIS